MGNKYDKLKYWRGGLPNKKQVEIAREWKEKGIHQTIPTSMISTANEYEGPDDSIYYEPEPKIKKTDPKRVKKLERKIWDLLEYMDEWNVDVDHFKVMYPETYDDLMDKLKKGKK